MRNTPIEVSNQERVELERRRRSRRMAAGDVRRASLILMLAEGHTYKEIEARLGLTAPTISLWKKRFLAERLTGLSARHKGRQPTVLTPKLEARILSWTRRAPKDGSTHWSTRRLGKQLGISHMMVARVWRRHGLTPHRFDRYMASNDPNFESKAAEIIGLYMNPPQHAAIFCVDEKTAIQALDRRDRRLPLSAGRAERHGFEYVRNGTLSLYAAFDTKSGEVLGKTAKRHTSAEFVAFLGDLVARVPADREIHVILDNLSAHKAKAVRCFLEENPRVHFHFTPTYSSWLNQVELWFGKIQRHVITRGIFTSVSDLNRKLMRYIRHYNKNPQPVKWKYADPAKRIKFATDS